MKQSIIILLFLSCAQQLMVFIAADCNVCNNQSNFACISETEYQQCTSGTPYGTINQCATGSYCSILGSCSGIKDLTACKDCKKCDSTNTFACVGTKSFSLCLGTSNYTEMQAQCTGDYVCNINDPRICVEGSPTCSFRDNPTEAPTTLAPTVPSPTTNSTAFCAAMATEGRYPIGTDADTTCHQYVHCYLINDVWYGPIYSCPGNTYYDSSKSVCGSKIPSTCTAAVAGLSFRSILLE